jgi:hypothetical protein
VYTSFSRGGEPEELHVYADQTDSMLYQVFFRLALHISEMLFGQNYC